MGITDKQRRKVNNAIDYAFRDQLKTAVSRKFGIEIETTYNIIALRLVSRRSDGTDFTEEELAYIQAFEAGYMAAWDVADKNMLDAAGGE